MQICNAQQVIVQLSNTAECLAFAAGRSEPSGVQSQIDLGAITLTSTGYCMYNSGGSGRWELVNTQSPVSQCDSDGHLRVQARAGVPDDDGHADDERAHRLRHQLCGRDPHDRDLLPAVPHGGAAVRAAVAARAAAVSRGAPGRPGRAAAASAPALSAWHHRGRPGGQRDRVAELPVPGHRHQRRRVLLPVQRPQAPRARRHGVGGEEQADLLPPRAAAATARAADVHVHAVPADL